MATLASRQTAIALTPTTFVPTPLILSTDTAIFNRCTFPLGPLPLLFQARRQVRCPHRYDINSSGKSSGSGCIQSSRRFISSASAGPPLIEEPTADMQNIGATQCHIYHAATMGAYVNIVGSRNTRCIATSHQTSINPPTWVSNAESK